jgi:hypothetical protein
VILVGALFAVLGLAFAIASWRSLRHGRVLAFIFSGRTLTALLFAALGALCFGLVGATQGYHALTREEIACEVTVEPTGTQTFVARFVFPDGRRPSHVLAGDQLYVDARILKWKPWVNVLGLHTAYELDRVAGRYFSLDDERARPRTVATLGSSKTVDLFDLRRQHTWLGILVDTEYGSATFVDVKSSATFEVRVSTTGLLVRAKPAAR